MSTNQTKENITDAFAQDAQSFVEQRKQVTILFADVSGFTAMSEALDPEEVNEIMNAMWARIDKAILNYGGTIVQHMGDGVMALWGIQAVHEDDPERAIHAALAMQTELSKFSEANLQNQSDPYEYPGWITVSLPPLRMRIGINTGPVFLGPVGFNKEYTAMGDAVNLASRLEHAAPVGNILISHNTYRHVRGVFDVQAWEPIKIKGKTEPVQVYQIEGAKPRAFRIETRGVEGIETRMIGRKAELEFLLDILQTVIEDRELYAVTIFGEAGLGKSRLLYEFINEVELLPGKVLVFNGRASEAKSELPYSLIRDVLFFRFEIQDNDPPEIARDKLEQGILALFGTTDEARKKAHFIGHLIGLDFSASPHLSGILDNVKLIRELAFDYTTQFFTTFAQESLTILCLDDLQWADDGSLDFVDHLVRTCTTVPMMICGLSRIKLLRRRPTWGEGRSTHTRLLLRKLTKRETRQLVTEILRYSRSIPGRLRDLVVDHAEGNPFFIEELIKVLIDQKIIIPGPDVWQVDESSLTKWNVPTTLEGVLQARLDSLSPSEKRALQLASVIGRVFWRDAVKWLRNVDDEVKRDEGKEDLHEVLEALRQKELLYRREVSAFAGTSEYIFKHSLLGEVAFKSVLRSKRRRYARAAAEWLIEQSGERANEFASAIAEFYDRAMDRERAAVWYGRAAQRAREIFVPNIAIDHYRKALELIPSSLHHTSQETTRRTLLIEWYDGLGEMLWMQARFQEAIEAYENLLLLAKDGGEALAPARAWNGLAFVYEHQGHIDAMLECAKQAEILAQYAGPSVMAKAELVRALNLQSMACYRRGETDAVKTLAERALALSSELGEKGRRRQAISLKGLGLSYYSAGQFEHANGYFEQSLKLFIELGDRRNEGAILSIFGEIARSRGDYSLAAKCYQDALTIACEIGDQADQIIYQSNLGCAFIGLDMYDWAEKNLRDAIELAAPSASQVLPETYSFLTEALLGQGRVSEALESAQHALALAKKMSNPELLAEAWRALGLVAANLSDPIKISEQAYDARACFAESLRIFTVIKRDVERARTLRDWARYELMVGNKIQGAVMWQQALQIFSRLNLGIEVERMKSSWESQEFGIPAG